MDLVEALTGAKQAEGEEENFFLPGTASRKYMEYRLQVLEAKIYPEKVTGRQKRSTKKSGKTD